MKDLKPGDTVRLASGGPVMTVAESDGDAINPCVKVLWFEADGVTLRAEALPAAVVVIVQGVPS